MNCFFYSLRSYFVKEMTFKKYLNYIVLIIFVCCFTQKSEANSTFYIGARSGFGIFSMQAPSNTASNTEGGGASSKQNLLLKNFLFSIFSGYEARLTEKLSLIPEVGVRYANFKSQLFSSQSVQKTDFEHTFSYSFALRPAYALEHFGVYAILGGLYGSFEESSQPPSDPNDTTAPFKLKERRFGVLGGIGVARTWEKQFALRLEYSCAYFPKGLAMKPQESGESRGPTIGKNSMITHTISVGVSYHFSF
jgi:opacity protein-like surface antigen